METPSVIIIGAGVAGVSAAAQLLSEGIKNVIILEAENRIGGRVNTVDFENGCVDLGAQWVHGQKGNIVYSMANPLDLLDDSPEEMTKSQCFFPNGSKLDFQTSDKLINICLKIIYESDRMKEFTGSLGDYFMLRFREILCNEEKVDISDEIFEAFLDWFQKFQNSIDGADTWFETSVKGHQEYWECEGNLLVKWKKGGFSNIIDLIFKKYPNSYEELPIKEKILFNKEVRLINWSDQGIVKVTCTDDSCYQATYVIVTVSLGVLKESSAKFFNPPLPNDKLNAIEGLGFGTVNKIFIKFPYRWWPDDCPGFNLLWEQDAKESRKDMDNQDWVKHVFGFYSVYNNPTILCGWIVGSPSRHMELSSDEEVKESCQQLLTRFLGHSFVIPPVEAILRSHWHSNPHFRGSYSFQSVRSDKKNTNAAQLAKPLFQNNKLAVLFAGEATHDHYYSTVHGALESGRREADRILSLYSKCIKSSL